MKRLSVRSRLLWSSLVLGLVLLAAVPLLFWLGALPMNRVPVEEQPPPLELEAAVTAYEQLGATYGGLKHFRSGYSVDSTEFTAGPGAVRDGALPAFLFQEAPRGKCPNVSVPFGVVFRGPQVTDAGLKELKGLNHLKTLDLRGAQVTDAGLQELTGLKNLTALDLHGSPVTDGALRSLREVGLLHALTRATGKGDQRPAGPEEVTALNLYRTRVTDAGLKELVGLTNLNTLFLEEKPVTDDMLRSLRAAGLLHVLPGASGKNGKLSGPDEVTILRLGSTRVTDAGLKEIAGLKNLTTLNLRGTQVTDKGLKEIREALPKCRVVQ